jgi:hypothetical protein
MLREYEQYTTIRNGEIVTLHRCRECSRHLYYATGVPARDNGFIPVEQTLNHLPTCKFGQASGRA